MGWLLVALLLRHIALLRGLRGWLGWPVRFVLRAFFPLLFLLHRPRDFLACSVSPTCRGWRRLQRRLFGGLPGFASLLGTDLRRLRLAVSPPGSPLAGVVRGFAPRRSRRTRLDLACSSRSRRLDSRALPPRIRLLTLGARGLQGSPSHLRRSCRACERLRNPIRVNRLP